MIHLGCRDKKSDFEWRYSKPKINLRPTVEIKENKYGNKKKI